MEQNPRFYLFNQLPSDANASGPRIILSSKATKIKCCKGRLRCFWGLMPAIITYWTVTAYDKPQYFIQRRLAGWQLEFLWQPKVALAVVRQLNNKSASCCISHYSYSNRAKPECSSSDIKGERNPACIEISYLIYLCVFVYSTIVTSQYILFTPQCLVQCMLYK